MTKSIGAIEFRSIGIGIDVSNKMVKKSSVEICFLKSICVGKYLIIVNGDVAEVEEAINFGVKEGNDYVADSFIINAVHIDIINALKNRYDSRDINDAVGVVETTKVCAGLKALDKTLKSSNLALVKIQLAFAIGGKLVYIVSGDFASVEYGINEGIDAINSNDIVSTSIIPSLHSEMVKNLL